MAHLFTTQQSRKYSPSQFSFRLEMALNGVYSGNGNGASTGRGGVGGAATALTKPKTRNSD